MLSIQPCSIGSAQKELAAIGIRASVCLEGENNIRTVSRNNFQELNDTRRFTELSNYLELWNVSACLFTHHTQDSRPGVLQFEVLIFESRAINGLSTCAVMVGEVSSLTHAAKSKDRRKMIGQNDSIQLKQSQIRGREKGQNKTYKPGITRWNEEPA